jgi:hypothetical protein
MGDIMLDLSSSYFECTTCPLAQLGYSSDGKKGKSQVNYGLLTDARESVFLTKPECYFLYTELFSPTHTPVLDSILFEQRPGHELPAIVALHHAFMG